jgi:hypothetical protein
LKPATEFNVCKQVGVIFLQIWMARKKDETRSDHRIIGLRYVINKTLAMLV